MTVQKVIQHLGLTGNLQVLHRLTSRVLADVPTGGQETLIHGGMRIKECINFFLPSSSQVERHNLALFIAFGTMQCSDKVSLSFE